MLTSLLVLAALAGAMTASTAVFVRWAALSRTALRASIVVFLLLMMTGMLAGALVYELRPGPTSAVEGLWLASAVMSASVGIVFAAFVREVRRPTAGPVPASVPARGAGFVATVVGLLLLNEFLMGWVFGTAAGGLARTPAPGLAGVLGFSTAVLVSPWFVFTMAGEMALSTYLLRGSWSRPAVVVLSFQAGLMLLSPPVLPGRAWTDLSLAASSAGMIVLFVFLMEFLYRARTFPRGFARYLDELLPVLALMMAGLFLWAAYGSTALFAIAVVLEMVVYFAAVLRPTSLAGGGDFSWPEAPAWTTRTLASVFVAELFMGALLAAWLEPGTYLASLTRLPLAGNPAVVLEHSLANGFYFFADTTATTWFLTMMGLEMGALVVLKLREVRGRELRVRLALMLGCYAAFTVFYPSLYYTALLPQAPGAGAATSVPLLGWSMGSGAAPLAGGVVGVLVATYAIFAGVTLLFGRRAVCSVFCSAAVMFQGTAIDAMKGFNRTSPVARRYLSSRLSGAYRVTSFAVVLALGTTSVLSFLDGAGTLSVSIAGEDPSVFLYALSFGVLWYVLFVTIPYAGDYNCVTMGWCYTGQIAGAFSRAGLFRLRVKDPEVCRRCTTLDCAKACPVGLTDMPGHFRRTGEFRSSKCCGVGACAEKCPYGNLYLRDVRHVLARLLGSRRAPAPTGLLPMAGHTAKPVANPAVSGRTHPAASTRPREL